MIRITVSNQKGGVSKTTTTVSLARAFADDNKRVLIIDTDPQGSIAGILNLEPKQFLSNYLIDGILFDECITKAHDRIDVMCSNRDTVRAEGNMMTQVAREFIFRQMFKPVEGRYDVILIDVSPSINLLQTCAMAYSEQILVPVTMDPQSFQGAVAAVNTPTYLNKLLGTNIRAVALLPVMVDRRLAITASIMASVKSMCEETRIPLLPQIRTDQAVTKAVKMGQFLVDFDPNAKAAEDYLAAYRELIKLDLEAR